MSDESLTPEETRKISMLARLHLTDEEAARFRGELASILGYIRKLDELDTSQVEPMSHAVDVANVLRKDEMADSLPRPAALANAPKTDEKTFLVPAILDSGS